jgi:Fe-S-cluster containining protein
MTLDEARTLECNRCGDCCDGTSEFVATDPIVGLPLFVWTRDGDENAFDLPEDRYEERFGHALIQPVIRGDGGLCVGEEFERDGAGQEYRSFKCAALRADDDGLTSCRVYDERPSVRPYHCGSFPVFGMEADIAILNRGEYIPHTAPLPRCTWYGVRIVGPWKETPQWRQHHEELNL